MLTASSEADKQVMPTRKTTSQDMVYFPIQNVLKMESSRSSVEVLPTISPTALTAIRKSIATSSSVALVRNASLASRVAVRARFNAS